MPVLRRQSRKIREVNLTLIMW